MKDRPPRFDHFQGVVSVAYPGEDQVALFILGSSELVLCDRREWSVLLDATSSVAKDRNQSALKGGSMEERDLSDLGLVEVLKTLSVL